jgi:hypothetical protein
MLNVSQNFKNDIVSTNQKLKPVLVISDADNNILFTLTQDKDELFDNSGNLIRTINCISKVSNVKISSEYDSKKLKINRLRCTLYNYYNINTKLSEYINTNVIGKNLYMFYKSPSTNVIDIKNELNKSDCALIYNGEINRIKFDDETINLSVEDKTQIKIANKSVPYMSIDKLPLEQRSGILSEYQDFDNVVPMTFGYVDKAPVLPYLENNNERILNVLFDFHPTAGNYRTAKIPKLLLDPPNGLHYCLYVKKDDDYIILKHANNTSYHHNIKFSKLELFSFEFMQTDYLFPELKQNYEDVSSLWQFKGFSERLVDSVYASNNGILNAKSSTTQDIDTNPLNNNINKINDNGNFEKKWYRYTNSYNVSDNLNITNTTNFDTGVSYYGPDTTGGDGRWIILKLKKGIDNNLVQQSFTGVSANTYFLADWQLYQDINESSVPNNSDSYLNTHPTEIVDRTGFFIAPLSPDVWKDGLNFASGSLNQVNIQADLNRLLLQSDLDLELIDDTSAMQEIYAPKTNTYLNAPMFLLKNEPTSGGNNYWSQFGYSNNLNQTHDYRGIQGLYYGINSNYIDEIHNADAHNLIAIFEYFPPYWIGSKAYQQGLRMDNIALLHSVSIDNLQEEEIYASIVGRKNNFFTEQLEYYESVNTDIDLDTIIKGKDEALPFDDILLSQTYNIFTDLKDAALEVNPNFFDGADPENAGGDNFFVTNATNIGNNFAFLSTKTFGSYIYPQGTDLTPFLIESLEQNFIDDSAIFNVLDFFKNYIWKTMCSPLSLYDLQRVHTDTTNTDFNNFLLLIESESFMKSVIAKIYQYLLQKDIEHNDFTFSYYSKVTQNIQNIDITDSINEMMQNKNWNDYQINDIDDYIDNLLIYLDDLIFSMMESMQSAIFEYQIAYQGDVSYSNVFDSSLNLNVFLPTFFPVLGGFQSADEAYLNLSNIQSDLYNYAESQIVGLDGNTLTTDGIIVKPSDIVMNILVNEMGYGKLNADEKVGENIITPDYTKFDMDSIIESRNAHNSIKMGFSIKEKTEGKQLIEDILRESRSYPRFTSDGKFGLLTIKDTYTYDDIDTIINLNDILTYKFEQTKREDITTSVKMFYRFDYGQDKYEFDYEISIQDINFLLEYQLNGFDNFNVQEIDTHKEIELKYHTLESSVVNFGAFTILNNCNPHNMVTMTLPSNYIELSVGDKIHLPLINNEKIFNIDYSKVSFLNGQAIYPLWIIMETNIGTDSITIKAFQLHCLDVTGDHKFEMPNEEYIIRGCTKQYSDFYYTNGNPIPNINYNPLANQHNDIESPYFDLNYDGIINVVDLVELVNHIIGGKQLTDKQKEKLVYTSAGEPKQDLSKVDILDVVSMINVITNN